MKERYNSYSAFFKKKYGQRLQKLSIDAGFGCPNRNTSDREKGGCTFCNNHAFNPSYCSPLKSITQQIDEGISFHEHRYRNAASYLAYFQAYSNTFAPLDTLQQRYEEALSHPKVDGIIIGTRPDCVEDNKLDYIASLRHFGGKETFVAVEYGIESCYDDTLARIRRGHTFATSRDAIVRTAKRGIHCGGHLILGLPGENRERMLDEVDIINRLPINSIKFHQLQILRGTAMENDTTARSNIFASVEEYIALVCDIVERLRPDITIERFAGEVPPRHQALPSNSWRRHDGKLMRNEEIPILVARELERRNTWQGFLYNIKNEKDA